MKVSSEDLLKRVDELVSLHEASALLHATTGSHGKDRAIAHAQARSATLSFLSAVFGPSHPYYTDFLKATNNVHEGHSAVVSIGILAAIKGEVAGGWLGDLRGLVSGGIFADFLEMAGHLLSEEYKDAAAVIAGSALEGHLRELCLKAAVTPTHADGKNKKADLINSELAAKAAYSKLDQKNVTAWLAIRNHAAHGEYGKYVEGQVRLLVDGVRDFITRNPR